jgi:primosomal protein N' (replication factor Y)
VTQQRQISPSKLLNVAIPLPLFSVFDYYPAKDVAIEKHQVGSRVKVFFRNRLIVGIITNISTTSTVNPSKIQPIVELLDDAPCFSTNLIQLLKWAADYYIHPLGEVFATAMPALLRTTNPAPDNSVTFWHPTQGTTTASIAKNAHRQSELLKLIQQHPAGLPDSTCIELGFNRQQLKNLESKKLIHQTREVNPAQHAKSINTTANPVLLNEEQSQIADDFREHNQTFQTFLLEGITGSGKTETYIACIQQILALGKQALLLVPEINLTPQTLQRFQTYFDDAIGVLHSGMTQKARYETWSLTKSGAIRIVIGTRSAYLQNFKTWDAF